MHYVFFFFFINLLRVLTLSVQELGKKGNLRRHLKLYLILFLLFLDSETKQEMTGPQKITLRRFLENMIC